MRFQSFSLDVNCIVYLTWHHLIRRLLFRKNDIKNGGFNHYPRKWQILQTLFHLCHKHRQGIPSGQSHTWTISIDSKYWEAGSCRSHEMFKPFYFISNLVSSFHRIGGFVRCKSLDETQQYHSTFHICKKAFEIKWITEIRQQIFEEFIGTKKQGDWCEQKKERREKPLRRGLNRRVSETTAIKVMLKFAQKLRILIYTTDHSPTSSPVFCTICSVYFWWCAFQKRLNQSPTCSML